MFEALRYRRISRGFDSFRPHSCPGVNLASKRHENQEYFLRGKGGRCIGLTILLPSYSERHEIWEPQPPGTCTGQYRHYVACTAIRNVSSDFKIIEISSGCRLKFRQTLMRCFPQLHEATGYERNYLSYSARTYSGVYQAFYLMGTGMCPLKGLAKAAGT